MDSLFCGKATAVASVRRTVTYEWVRIHHPFSSPNKKTPSKRMVFFAWWGKVDSNHRSDKQQIYSLSPLATREFPQIFYCVLEPVDGLEPPTY